MAVAAHYIYGEYPSIAMTPTDMRYLVVNIIIIMMHMVDEGTGRGKFSHPPGPYRVVFYLRALPPRQRTSLFTFPILLNNHHSRVFFTLALAQGTYSTVATDTWVCVNERQPGITHSVSTYLFRSFILLL